MDNYIIQILSHVLIMFDLWHMHINFHAILFHPINKSYEKRNVFMAVGGYLCVCIAQYTLDTIAI